MDEVLLIWDSLRPSSVSTAASTQSSTNENADVVKKKDSDPNASDNQNKAAETLQSVNDEKTFPLKLDNNNSEKQTNDKGNKSINDSSDVVISNNIEASISPVTNLDEIEPLVC